MWPFKKKAPEGEVLTTMILPTHTSNGMPVQSYGRYYPTKCRSCGGTNTNAPEDCTKCQKHQQRKEEKVKLEAGKYYETYSGVYECIQAGVSRSIFVIGGNYYNDRGLSLDGNARKDVLREVPSPLTLIPGELYQMEDGKVERCSTDTSLSYIGFPYRIGCFSYKENGEPYSEAAPKILYRLRVNEHMKPHIIGFDVARGGDYTVYSRSFKNAEEFDLWIKHGNRGPIYSDTIRKRMGTEPMRVQYKPHTDCEKREVEIPSGYEKVVRSESAPRIGDLYDECGFWTEPMMRDGIAFVPAGHILIRSKPAPFKVDGPGWYRMRGGGWVKDPAVIENGVGYCFPRWHENGYSLDGVERAVDIVARATDAQAAILDAL